MRVLLAVVASAGGEAGADLDAPVTAAHGHRLVTLAGWHGLDVLLAEYLRTRDGALGRLGPAADLLRRNVAVRTGAALAQQRALETVGDVCETRAAPALAIKGAALARTLYSDIAHRTGADVDVVVPGPGFVRVASALEAQGWSVLRRGGAAPRWWAPAARVLVLRTPYGVDVDLHQAFSDAPGRPVLERQRVWQEARPLRPGAAWLRVPSSAHHFVHVAEHALRSRWVRMAWLGDLLRLARSPDADGASLDHLARRCGASRAVAVATQLLGDVGMRWGPPPVGRSARVQALVRAARLHWEQPMSLDVHAHDRVWARRCRERGSDPWRSELDRLVRGALRRCGARGARHASSR